MKNNYNDFLRKVEWLLLTMTTICFTLLIFFQTIDSNNYTSVFSNNYTSIGIDKSNYGIIIIAINDTKFSNVEVIKNGKIENSFKKDKEISIKVKDKDILEINGSMYQEPVIVKIVGISKNIKYPNLNQIIKTSKSIELIGEVRLK